MVHVASLVDTPKARLIEQLKVSATGVLIATLTVPFGISGWTPMSFAILWGVVYFSQSMVFFTLVAWFERPWLRQLWAISAAAMFVSVNVSVLIWADGEASAVWLVGMMSFTYISFQIATLPYLDVPNWWLGASIVSASIVVVVAIEVHPLLGVALVPLVVSMTIVAGRNRALRNDLASRLEETNQLLLTDPLTGLLNRRGLEVEIERLEGQVVTMAMFDADRFKLINDTQGYGVGDQALQMVAERLTATLRGGWAIARQGGDEFVAVRSGHITVDDEVVAPFQMALADGSGQTNFTVSCGIATGTLLGAGDRLLRETGFALRHAKRDGEKLVRIEGALRERFDRSVLMTEVFDADSPIVPVVQMIVDDFGVAGCELLARWRTSDGSLLAPAQFMDMLVENGLLGQLDNEMLEHAVKLAAELEQLEIDAFVSANIGAGHLLDPDLISHVTGLLETYNVAPHRLMIEITESERLGTNRLWEDAVRGLRDLGVLLAIDDFGAGYSSIARLKTLPISHLKLDRTLVISANGPLGEIIRGVTRFCQDSGIGVVAEGIETAEQHESMRAMKVDFCQGFLFGRPMRREDFIRDVLRRRDVGQEPRSFAVEELYGVDADLLSGDTQASLGE